jgi:hypothetical protein
VLLYIYVCVCVCVSGEYYIQVTVQKIIIAHVLVKPSATGMSVSSCLSECCFAGKKSKMEEMAVRC